MSNRWRLLADICEHFDTLFETENEVNFTRYKTQKCNSTIMQWRPIYIPAPRSPPQHAVHTI